MMERGQVLRAFVVGEKGYPPRTICVKELDRMLTRTVGLYKVVTRVSMIRHWTGEEGARI